MQLLFRLPFVLLETVVRQGVRGLGTLVRLLRGGEDEETFTAASPRPVRADFGGGAATSGFAPAVEEPELAPEPAPEPAREPAPPTAAEAIARRQAREAEATVAPPVHEPEEPAPVAGLDEDEHVDSEPTLVESFGPSDDVGAALQVDEPWDGYDGMPATAVVSRLRGADDATKGVVRLYEQMHKKRQTILRATG